MLMEVPLNIIHNYIAAPVLFGLGVDLLRRYMRNKNRTSLFLAATCLLATLSVLSFGIPVLFTHNLQVLNAWTFVGDVAFSFSLLLLWFISIQAFLGRWPAAVKIATTLVIGLTIACIVDAVQRTLIPPFDGIELMRANGQLALLYKDTLSYSILNGLDSIVLIFIAIFFWRQGKAAPDAGQRIRVRGVALGFSIAAGGFILVPALLPVHKQFQVSTILWIASCLTIAVAGILGWSLSRRTLSVDTTQLTK